MTISNEELERVLEGCSCGANHLTDNVGECDVPALVAEVRRLREELSRAKDGWEDEYGRRTQLEHDEGVVSLDAVRAVAEEREACAMIAQDEAQDGSPEHEHVAIRIKKAIRARGDK